MAALPVRKSAKVESILFACMRVMEVNYLYSVLGVDGMGHK